MSIEKKIENLAKYQALLPWAVGGVVVVGVGVGAYYLISQLKGLDPREKVPEFLKDVLATTGEFLPEDNYDRLQDPGLKELLDQAYKQSLDNKDMGSWDEAVLNLNPDTKLYMHLTLKRKELQFKIDELLKQETIDTANKMLEEELILIEQDKQNKLDLINMNTRIQLAQKAAEEALIQAQKNADAQLIDLVHTPGLDIYGIPTVPAPTTTYTWTPEDLPKTTTETIPPPPPVTFKDYTGMTWDEFQNKYGNDRVDEYLHYIGVPVDRRAELHEQMQAYDHFTYELRDIPM